MALEISDFIFAEKPFNSFGERSDHTVLVLLGLFPVESDIVSLNTKLFKLVVKFMVFMRDVEESLGRNAAYVKTSASQ